MRLHPTRCCGTLSIAPVERRIVAWRVFRTGSFAITVFCFNLWLIGNTTAPNKQKGEHVAGCRSTGGPTQS